jgi:hypothetical protein
MRTVTNPLIAVLVALLIGTFAPRAAAAEP